MMVVGSCCSALGKGWAPFVYAPGALLFAVIQIMNQYDGDNHTIRRLSGIMMLSDVLFILTAVVMIADIDNLFGLPYAVYIKYVHNNWVIVLLIAAILQLYASQRISHELRK